MAWLKLQADRIFDGYRFQDNKVLILQAEGRVEALVDADQAGEDIQPLEGLLTPGFINCHCHLELSHLMGQIPENTGLAAFVGQVVQKRQAPDAQIQEAIRVADQQMLQNGIVGVGDICNSLDSLAQKSYSSLHYHSFIEAIGFDPTAAEAQFSQYEHIYQQFARARAPQEASITPHAPYSVSDPLWERILSHNHNRLLSIHNQETPDETLWFTQKTGGFVDLFQRLGLDTGHVTATGKSSLQSYLQRVPPETHLLLVHNVVTSDADIRFSQQQDRALFWCLCPNANQYISRVLPPLPLLVAHGCTIVLGTDSLASNHQLSIWQEIKTLQQAFAAIPLEQMLRWATINGAQALKIDDRYGSFEKGKQPGLVQITAGEARRFWPQ